MRKLIVLCILSAISIQYVHAQKMTVKDSDSNILMEVNDEGTMGAITLPDTNTALSSETNKLYNLNGSLIWNGTALGTIRSAGGWTDDGTVVRLTTESDFVGIGTTSPEFKLSLDDDGSILAEGTYGSGTTLSTSGSGARLIWYPRKAAFRAGYVDGTQWDDANIGSGSIAMGAATTANGLMSTALGRYTTASGVASTAMGSYSTASGDNSTALGYYLKAESYGSMAIGRYNVSGGSAASWIDTDPLFEIGIGTSSSNKANAVTVLKNGNVGVGISSPSLSLDVKDSLGINGTRLIYLPDQTDFEGTLIVGNGGGNLGHIFCYGGKYNTSVGIGALNAITDGLENTAIGYRAPYSHRSYGPGNTAIGAYALYSNEQSGANTAIGHKALYSMKIGEGLNTACGALALYSNEGEQNSAMGCAALSNNDHGHYNTACGSHTLYNNITGSRNTALGKGADVSIDGLTNATAIGYGAIVDASNKVRIGNTSVTKIEGQVDLTYFSDKNKKENFLDVDGEYVLNEIRQFDLKSWNYIGHDPKTARHYGPTSQDFFKSFGQDALGTVGTDTTLCGSDVDGINMIAIQTLEKRTAEDRIRISELEKVNKQILAENEKLKTELKNIKNIVIDLYEKIGDENIQIAPTE